MADDWHSISNIYIIQHRLRPQYTKDSASTNYSNRHPCLAADNNPVNQSISSIGSTYNTNTASPRNIYLTKQVVSNKQYI